MLNPLKYNKHFDKLSYDEKMLLEEAKKSIADFVESSPEISDVNFATRNAHAKTHSVLQGVLQINSDLCTSIKYLFDKDEYDIIARLSNANMKISKKPRQIPAYGFAFKIKDEGGRTIANFPLVNFPLFPVNSPSVFLKLFTNINRFYLKKVRTFFPLIKSLYKILPSTLNRDFVSEIFKFLNIVLVFVTINLSISPINLFFCFSKSFFLLKSLSFSILSSNFCKVSCSVFKPYKD